MGYVGRGLNQDGGQYRKLDDISSTFNGSNTSFSLAVSNVAVTPTAQNLLISINGVIQEPGSAFSMNGSTITFTEAPAGDSTFFGVLMGEASFIAHDTVGANEMGVSAGTVKASRGVVVDSSKNISGFNKIEIANSGSTDDALLITSTEDGSTASPVITLKRNSGSPADSDYIGQVKFKGENDNDQDIVYAKVTGKIQDASDGSEDGLIEFANKKAGSNVITARLRSDSFQLLNSTNFSVAGTSTMTGNVTLGGNISGSSSSTGSVGRLQTNQTNSSFGGNILTVEGTTNVNQDLTSDASPTFAGGTITGDFSVGGTLTAQEIHTEFESASILFTSGSTKTGNSTDDIHQMTGSLNVSGSLFVKDGTLTVTDNVDFNGDLDVDGTTNLDAVDIDGNVDIAGTITQAYSNSSGTDYLDGDAGLYLANAGSDGTMIKFGDTNAGLVYGGSGTGTFKVMQRQNTVFSIDASRRVSIGTTSPLTYGGYHPAKFSVDGESFTGTMAVTEYQDGISGGLLAIGHSRGTISSKAKLNQNDQAGRLIFSGYNGTDFRTITADIRSIITSATGDIADGVMAGNLQFATNAGGGDDASIAMTIDSSQRVGIGQGSPTNSPLEVNLTQSNGTAGSSGFAHFGSNGNTDGYIQGISLGYRESNANYRKIAIAVRGRGDGATRSDLCLLVDTANDAASATLQDAKLTIDGLTGATTLRDGIRFNATNGADPAGDDHLDVPIKFAAYTHAVDSTDVSNGSVDMDLDIYRDNYLSLNALLFDSNTNVVYAGLPADESWLKQITVFAAGGVRIYFGSSVAVGDTVKLLVAYTGNTG